MLCHYYSTIRLLLEHCRTTITLQIRYYINDSSSLEKNHWVCSEFTWAYKCCNNRCSAFFPILLELLFITNFLEILWYTLKMISLTTRLRVTNVFNSYLLWKNRRHFSQCYDDLNLQHLPTGGSRASKMHNNWFDANYRHASISNWQVQKKKSHSHQWNNENNTLELYFNCHMIVVRIHYKVCVCGGAKEGKWQLVLIYANGWMPIN